jgi:hypothetical protein
MRMKHQPRPFKAVNLNGCTDCDVALLVSFVMERMHTDLLHQGNKGNEEFLIAACDQSGLL